MALSLAACGDDEDASPRDSTPPEDTMDTSTTPPPDPTEPTEPTSVATSASATGDDPVLAAAVDEVARRRGVGTGAVYVAVDERVTWRDGSIGCPESGKLYTQALVPGRRVVLRVDGRDFAYHGARSRPLRYCANPSADATAPGGGDT